MIDIMALTPLQLERFIHLQGLVDRQANEAARVRALRDSPLYDRGDRGPRDHGGDRGGDRSGPQQS